jgi:hypothetical protein
MRRRKFCLDRIGGVDDTADRRQLRHHVDELVNCPIQLRRDHGLGRCNNGTSAIINFEKRESGFKPWDYVSRCHSPYSAPSGTCDCRMGVL